MSPMPRFQKRGCRFDGDVVIAEDRFTQMRAEGDEIDLMRLGNPALAQ